MMNKSAVLFILIACISVVFISSSGAINAVETNSNNQENINASSENIQIDESKTGNTEEKRALTIACLKKSNEYIKVPGVSGDMYSPSYWISKISNVDQIIMNMDEINEFNKSIIKNVDKVYDIRQYEESLEKAELIKLINEYKLPDKTMYSQQGEAIRQNIYKSIINNQNISAIIENNNIRYGITIRRTSLRSFPTDMGAYDSKKSELDRFQETGCQIGEPLLILHESADKEWLFVQMYNCRGWVKSKDIAMAYNKEQLFSYTDSIRFIVVTENCVVIESKELGKIELNMGAKIPISDDNNTITKIILPTRDEAGGLKFTSVEVKESNFINEGYLPYTKANVIRQAFKILGTSYDWGDKNGGYDCSSFIMSVYKTFGFCLPRNAGQQAMVPGKNYVFSESDDMKRREVLFKSVEPGSAIFMPGHTMMYLGENDGVPFIIHSFIGYSIETQKGYEFIPVNSTTVTPAIIYTSSGHEYINKFTSVVSIENNYKE